MAAQASISRDLSAAGIPHAFLASQAQQQQRRIAIARCSSDAAGSARRFKGPVPLSTFREDPFSTGGGSGNGRSGGWGGDGGGGAGGGGGGSSSGDGIFPAAGIFAAFLRGWSDRVSVDPQFPFKVFMEEIVGVGANVIGDMASRPNFGLNELDFVFSTMVVGSLVNFVLMYMLAPTSASSASRLPWIFANCPSGHMFEPGAFGTAARLGTFVYKGVVFAAVGFAAGLVGTALSSALLTARKRVDPDFVQQNESPPTVLNAATWAAHMGFSANLRYQALNGLEFALARSLHPAAFKAAVVVTRAVNNLLGGYTFVALARATGSQRAAPPAIVMEDIADSQKLD